MDYTVNTPVLTKMSNLVNDSLRAAFALWNLEDGGANGLPGTVKFLVCAAKDLGLNVQLDQTRNRQEAYAAPCRLVKVDDDASRYAPFGEDDDKATHALRVCPGDQDDEAYQARLYSVMLACICEYRADTDLRIARLLESSPTGERDKAQFLGTLRMMTA